jgi:eukaryotic-like serine/threonine-protein kinase
VVDLSAPTNFASTAGKASAHWAVVTVVTHPWLRIADLEFIRLIGSGSYGDVWLARGVTGAYRAVKVVWRNRFQDVRPYEREFEGITRFATISLREPSQLALLHAGRNDA